MIKNYYYIVWLAIKMVVYDEHEKGCNVYLLIILFSFFHGGFGGE